MLTSLNRPPLTLSVPRPVVWGAVLARGGVRALCLSPVMLLLLSSVQTAGAASLPTRAGVTRTTPSPTPTLTAPPDQTKPASSPTVTSPTGSDQTSTSTSQPATTASTNATALRREVFGYATAGSLGNPTIGYPSWNFDLLSTVAFFSINVRYDGQLVGDSNFTVWDSSTLAGLVSTAHAHGTKVVVTITGPGNPIDLCDALYNDQKTISQLIPQVQAKGVDGVNIDYEGQLTQCHNVVDPSLDTTDQALMTKLAKDLRAALDAVKPGYYLSIATYSGSAAGNDGFFNIPNLNQYVNSFFVMAYDMDYANQPYAPLSCSRFCMAPVSPLANYYWNDSTSMSQYSSVVGPSKTILGQPYYGRVACVASPSDHATATGSVVAATYIGAAEVSSSPDVKPGTFAIHRDANDPNGLDRWDSWYDNSLGCWRVMHWSDATTLGVRYNFVNQMNLRGVGLWTLNYGGGSGELWSTIQTYFKGCYSVGLSASPASSTVAGTSVALSASAACPDPNPQYEFWILAPGASSYQPLQSYSTNSTYTWSTGGLFPGVYRIVVWARDSGSTGEFGNSFGTWDTYNAISYTVITHPCSAVGLGATPSGSAGVGTAVGVTAHASGCPNPLYQFWTKASGSSSWAVTQPYSTSNTWSWATAGKAPGAYQVAVWARDASSPGTYGNSSGRWDAGSFSAYTVTTCTGVGLTSAPLSSAGVGASVTFTAAARGCPNPSPVYQFWLLAPGASGWTSVQGYSTANTWSWSTTGKAPGVYRVAVWVRDASSGGAFSNSSGSWDVATFGSYTVTTCTGVSLSSAPASTATVGSSVVFTARAAGCPNPSPVYEFWLLAPGASSWTLVQAYSTSNAWTWSTAGKTTGTYQVAVWVRDASSGGAFSNSTGSWDAGAFVQYTLK
jgi:spore germination protein YaaH